MPKSIAIALRESKTHTLLARTVGRARSRERERWANEAKRRTEKSGSVQTSAKLRRGDQWCTVPCGPHLSIQQPLPPHTSEEATRTGPGAPQQNFWQVAACLVRCMIDVAFCLDVHLAAQCVSITYAHIMPAYPNAWQTTKRAMNVCNHRPRRGGGMLPNAFAFGSRSWRLVLILAGNPISRSLFQACMQNFTELGTCSWL